VTPKLPCSASEWLLATKDRQARRFTPNAATPRNPAESKQANTSPTSTCAARNTRSAGAAATQGTDRQRRAAAAPDQASQRRPLGKAAITVYGQHGVLEAPTLPLLT
jgi:hypothetical protein